MMKNKPSNTRVNMKLKIKGGEVCEERASVKNRGGKSQTEKRMTEGRWK